ncbi:MAG: putative Ig domain-containing protein, partial [Rhodanobacter sp.]
MLLSATAMWPVLARAANECPTFNETVASNQAVEFNVLSCSINGVQSVTQPSHGTATIVGAKTAGNIQYQNTDGSATSDQFTFVDDDGETILVQITIGTPTYPPIVISPSTMPNGNVGQSYSPVTFSSTGGDGGPTYTYNVSEGNLPNGMNFNGTGISGTPTESGTFAITVTSQDTHGNEGQQNYSFTINGGVISVSPTTAPTGNLYTSYLLTMNASGGTAPYTYTYGSTGSLPPGITFNAGTFTGTPTQTGTFTYAVNVADSAGNSERVDYTFTISPPNITVSPSSLSDATQYSAYSQQLSASGGYPTGSYTYKVNGTLPTGLTLSNSGLLSGTPTGSGTTSFSVTATDSSPSPGPYTGTQSYSLKVNANPPTITTSSLPAGTVDTAYNQTITGSGGVPTYTFTISAGSLPAGITLASNGTLSGTPTAGGSFPITVKLTDSASNTATQAYTLSINPATVTFTPGTLTAPTLHVAYNQTFTGSGGTSPYHFAVASGSLPPGLVLSSTGVLSGAATATGAFNFNIIATDSSTGTGPYGDTVSYTVTVTAPTIVLSPSSLSTAQVGVATSQTISASGGSGSYTFAVVSGTLPNGVSLSSAGTLSGTPTEGGSFPITVTATDSNTNTGSQTYTLTVNNAGLSITPTTLSAGTDGVSYSQNLAGNGGTAPYTFSISSGALPAGVTLSSTGTLSGTPSQVGTANFVLTVHDSSTGTGPYTTTQSYSLAIAVPTPTLAPASGTLSGNYAQAFTETFVASGGTAPYTYAVTSGTLPSGLSLNASTGALTGTPTATGSFPITITATDHSTGVGAPFTASTNYTLAIGTATIAIAPTSVTGATVGVAYPNTQLTASGGIGPYTYTIPSGALPNGITLSSGGLLSGTPTAAGNFSFTVQATDANGISGTRTYTLLTANASVVLSPASLPPATAESAYSQSFGASGGTAPYTYAVTSGSLPAGLSLNTSTGALTGTPTAAGSFIFTVRATDSSTGTGAPFFSARSYTFTVNVPSVTISPSSLPNPQIAVAYSQSLTASGGNGSYTYSVSSGSLPSGLTLSANGSISGTPTAAGSFNVTITATDGLSFTGTQSYTMTVATPALTLSPASLPIATAESAYSQNFSASGGTAPYTYAVTSGSLPAGLSLNTSTGALAGTPTAAGSFIFTVRATDSSTGTGAPFFSARSYTFTVNAPSVAISPSSLSGMQVAVAYNQQLTASGGNGSYTYSISSGSLPNGLTLSAGGLISGTPTTAGNFSFTVTAKDSLNFTGSQAYSVSAQQAKPIAVNDTASTPADQPVTINVTSVDTGPITSIAIVSQPAQGTAAVNGLAIVYTPKHNFYGTDTLTYTATGPGGTSAASTVTITVTPLAVPTVAAQSVTMVAGNTASINPTTGATGGPFTAISIAKAPSSGTATVSGNAINYTAAANASGQITFTYTLTNAFGVSQPATVTVTVDPRPLIAPQNISSVAGRSVLVNLTQGASGGPFTAATLVSLSPSSAGSASIVPIAGGYELHFTSAATFSGVAVVTYTLSNAYA